MKKWTAEQRKAFGAKMKAAREVKKLHGVSSKEANASFEEDLDAWLAARLVTPEPVKKPSAFGNVYAEEDMAKIPRNAREDDGIPDVPSVARVDVTDIPVSMPKNYVSELTGTKAR